MKFLLLLTLITTNVFAIGGAQIVKSSDDITGLSTAENLVINPGFELGVNGWTGVGVSPTSSTTTPYRGNRKALWDSSAAAQTLTSTAVTVPQWLIGRNAVIGCFVKATSGTATHTLNAFDGTNNVATGTITSSTNTYALTTINFVAPSSGTLAVRLTSVASNEPEISVDNCFISDASLFNLSQVNQTKVAEAFYATTASCDWSRTNTALGDFTSTAACPAPTVTLDSLGCIQTTDADLPQITCNNAPPGNYTVMATWTGAGTAAGSANQGFAISDGTSILGQINTNQLTNAVVHGYTTKASFNYTSSGNRTWKMQGSAATNGVSILNSSVDRRLTFTVLYTPSQSDQAYRPELQNATGYLQYAGALNCTWDVTNTVSLAAFGADTDCATPTVRGIAQAPGTKIPGFTVPSLAAGRYRVVFTGTFTPNTSTICTYSINDGTTNAGNYELRSTATAADGRSGVIEAEFEYTSAQSSRTFQIFSLRTGGSSGCLIDNPATAQGLFTGAIYPVTQSLPAPVLVGSVTSNSTGAERIERARITVSNTASAVAAQSGSSFSVANGATAGLTTVTISPAFSAEPQCQCTVIGAATTSATHCIFTATPTTTTVLLSRNRAGVAENGDVNLSCQGPR